ncbi:MAG TPA: hypothetical protein VGR88_02360, partial [Ktedonobacterales bacterium]|nr:hypothetical protein [Ktedonobacterales bacterium]
MSGAGNSWQFGDQNAGGGGLPLRRVLRFGQKIRGDDVPTAPQRYRGVDGPSGKLVGARLRP